MSEVDKKYEKLYSLLEKFNQEVQFRINENNLGDNVTFTSCWAQSMTDEQQKRLAFLQDPTHPPRDGIREPQHRAEKLLEFTEIKLAALKEGNLVKELASLKCYDDKETLKQLIPKEFTEDSQMAELIQRHSNLANACELRLTPSI